MTPRIGYVYILHFERPLSHSQHYIGCTHDPRSRWIQHAQGRGARIVAAAMEQGIGWRVGALGTTHHAGMRRLERRMKDWHGAADMCEQCNPEPRAIPGTTGYPLDALPFATDSASLAALSRDRHQVVIRLTTPEEPVRTSDSIKRLMKGDKDALGFIPVGGGVGLTDAMIRGRVALAEVDGVVRGYCLFCESEAGVKVQQIVVNDVYRGQGLARRMLAAVSVSRQGPRMQARVRADLPACGFWERMGFELKEIDTHGTSAADICVYVRGTDVQRSHPLIHTEG